MAENETLDFGHKSRWRRSRNHLRDPASTLDQFIRTAADDCQEAIRLLPAVLRKGTALLALVRALEAGSTVAIQEAVATFKEKRLANIVLAALRCTPSGDKTELARSAAESIIETLIDQIAARSKREKRFISNLEQTELRNALGKEFSPHLTLLSETIEASLRGNPVRLVRKAFPSQRMAPRDVARMSLVVPANPQERPSVR